MYFSSFAIISLIQIPFGIFLDRSPIKPTLIFLLLVLMISQTTISLMFEFRPQGYFIIILIMRSFFGICGEGLYTIQCVVMSIYAKN